MAKDIPYEKQTIDHPNPIARFAHRKRLKHSQRIVLENLEQNGCVVDYGCGQGRFLNQLNLALQNKRLKIQLCGYDPYMKSLYEGYVVVDNPNEIQDNTVDVITILEVCEHLTKEEFQGFIEFTLAKLRPSGRVLVTVPIMIGPAVLVKELVRCLLFRRLSDTTPLDLFKAAFFAIPPPRAANIKTSHRGYDWRKTCDVMSAHFQIQKIDFSPLPLIGWFGNSQAIMLFKRRA